MTRAEWVQSLKPLITRRQFVQLLTHEILHDMRHAMRIMIRIVLPVMLLAWGLMWGLLAGVAGMGVKPALILSTVLLFLLSFAGSAFARTL